MLKQCDLKKPTCSPCHRAQQACQGYRDTDTIRFDDQTDLIRTRTLGQKTLTKPKDPPVPMKLRHLPQDLQVIGRQMFFAYYVSDFSHTWDFVFQYTDVTTAPEHLSLGIDAVSLAFLSHQVSSPTAKRMGTRKYVEALRKVNKAVQDPDTAAKMSTFEAALLLDLFEKMMISISETNAARHAHVEGALALVKLRGISNFHKGPELRALLGLSLNATICSLSTGNPIPQEVREIRKHASQFVDTTYPKWRLSECILDVTDLPHDLPISPLARVARNSALDRRLETISREAGPAWSYARNFVSAHDPRVCVPDGFFPLYDVYPDRTITQMWNTLRLTRIQLCEDIVESCLSLHDAESIAESQRAKQVILEMVREVCASCPQMTNCAYAARQKLPSGVSPETQHSHTMAHLLDVYVMIFALFVVAWARNCPEKAREWAVGQLEHVAEHFGIREAANVLVVLRGRGKGDRGDPWYVYCHWGGAMFAESYRFGTTYDVRP